MNSSSVLPTSPSSISARIDDPLENQLKFVIFIVKIYCITSVLRLALMAVEADRGDVKRFMLVDVIPVGVFRDPSVFPFTFLGSETLKFHFGLSLRRVEEVRKVGGGGGGRGSQDLHPLPYQRQSPRPPLSSETKNSWLEIKSSPTLWHCNHYWHTFRIKSVAPHALWPSWSTSAATYNDTHI